MSSSSRARARRSPRSGNRRAERGMDLELKGKTALVTGGSRGIGFAIAERLAIEGCALRLVSRQQDKLDQAARTLAERHGAKIQVHAADLARSDDVRAVYPLLEGIDILV